MNLDRKAIRQLVRQRRRALSGQEQTQAASALVAQARISGLLAEPQACALYISNDGELDPSLLIQALWQVGCTVVLPVLHPFSKGHLLFLRYEQNSVLVNNRYNIPEPTLNVQSVVLKNKLDIIFVPLVAFDQHGNRLGMGGGYYDRTLASLPKHTRLIGLAHDIQEVQRLPKQAWDVSMGGILTPSRFIKTK